MLILVLDPGLAVQELEWSFRGAYGAVLAAASKELKGSLSAHTVKALATREGTILAAHCSVESWVLVSDVLNVVRAIQQP
ncbi:hypothetical protein TIFTF001_033967 [Ficus carica]|uniref:Uncharacterized protein n=1 Tax=Ficus carica TaxID=3494 RepID=A0AA88JA29_FICCA|nr:hypothetical protein TIFTF001_033967 [Ficus carica]